MMELNNKRNNLYSDNSDSNDSCSDMLIHLQSMVRSYRQLLDTIRKERDLLIEMNYDELVKNNQLKEAQLLELKNMDQTREVLTREILNQLGLKQEKPRLLEIANHIGGSNGDRLRSIHSTLELLLRRLMDLNRENEAYSQNALVALNGAMTDMKEVLMGRQIYVRGGGMTYGAEASGHLMCREA